MSLSDTIAPKSDQLDAVDLLSGPRTFTVERVVVRKGDEQPATIHLREFDRPWKPGKSMRRVLVACWGPDETVYPGRRVRLYCDPEVSFGGDKVGGTRISHLSHIDGTRHVPLLVSRGRSAIFTVQPLIEDGPVAPRTKASELPLSERISMALASFAGLGISQDRLEAKLNHHREQWGPVEVAALGGWFKAITEGGADPAALIPELQDSRPSALGGAPAVEEGTPEAMGDVPDPAGEVGSEQRLPIAPVGPSVLSGTRARLRGQAIATIDEGFERLLGAPLDREEVNWYLGLIVGHPVKEWADLDTDDLRKAQAKLDRFQSREQLEALNQGGGE